MNQVRRLRVDQLLDRAVLSPFAVVCAGAGFGKTRAVSSYLQTREARKVWLSLNELDNIQARFWDHFTVAVSIHRPRLAKQMKQLGFPDTLQRFHLFLSELTEELYQDNQFVIFVFDNLQVISEPSILKFLAGIIAVRMENSCIMFLTRRWPVTGLDTLITPEIIDTDMLRFTNKETFELLRMERPDISESEAAHFHNYVSGWPVALSLAARYTYSYQELHKEQTGVLHARPLLFTLFETLIFSQYTPGEQELLIRLSVLESFPRGLVAAVSGEQYRDLGSLLDNNIFIKYDAAQARFYFLPLYLEFLREKLQAVNHDKIDETYEKAGVWCQENGHYYDAVNYYRHGRCYDKLWKTLLLFQAGRHTKSEADFLIKEIETLPEEYKYQNPMTRIVLSLLLLNNLRFSEATEMIEEIRQELEAADTKTAEPELLGEYYTARGLITLGLEDAGFADHFEKAASLLPHGSRRWGKGLRLVDFGPGLNLQNAEPGSMDESLAEFQRGVPLIGQVLHGTGQGLDKLCVSEALFLTGHTRAAIDPAYKALYEANSMGQFDIVGNALFMLLRIYTSIGEYKELLDTLEHVRRYEQDQEAANLGIWDIIKGWFYSEVGVTEQVPLWIRNAVQNGYPPISIDRALLIRMRCLISESKVSEALALAEQFEYLAKSKRSVVSLIYIEIGRAVLHHYSGNLTAAVSALEAAYHLAKGNQIIMPFVEHGNRMRSLLEKIQSREQSEIPGEWLKQIHAKASTFAKRHAYLTGRYELDNKKQFSDFGLSRREIEILSHLSQGLTRDEIGESMKLSGNTVKSMLKQVYAKLGAINSVDAVRIAMLNQLI